MTKGYADKTKIQLIKELEELSQQVTDFNNSESIAHKLETSKIRYRRLFEAAQDGILILDAVTAQIVDVNPFLIEMLGYSKEEFLGKRLWEVVPFRNIETAKSAFAKLQSERYIRYEDMPLETKNGKLISVEFVSNVYDVDQISVIQCNIRDITLRKNAEQAEKAAEQKLSLIFESVPEGITVTDLGSIISYTNAANLTMHGLHNREELVGRNAFEFIDKKDHARAMGNLKKAMMGEVIKSAEYTMLGADGGNFAGELSASLFKDASGTPQGFVAVISDITERKRVEECLASSERKYRQLIEEMQEGVWIIDKDAHTTFANPHMAEMLGYTVDEMQGKPLFSFMDERGVEIAKRLLERRSQGVMEQHDFEFMRKDGRRVYVILETSPISDEAGIYVGALGCATDITERRQAEEALKTSTEALAASEKRYSTIFQSAAEGILIADIATKQFKYANPAICRMLGYSQEELKEMTLGDIHPKDSLKHVVSEFEAQARGEKTLAEGLPCLRKDGTLLYADINSAGALLDGTQCNVGFFTDITERIRLAELEIEASAAKLANQTKSNFLASMSHELRTPLNAVIGFAQVLQEQYFGQLKEKQAEYVNYILESGRHLLSLINDILDLSKIESGKETLEFSSVSIKELVESGLLMIREKVSKHGISLNVRAVDNINGLKISADERKVRQIVFNLLSNAAKFTPDGGSITVEVKKEAEEVIISVLDTGVGITPEQQGKLFQRFYQVHSGTADKTPGSGLGLVIAKELTEMQGGRIWVESEGLGMGSCFFFTLPLHRTGGENGIEKKEHKG